MIIKLKSMIQINSWTQMLSCTASQFWGHYEEQLPHFQHQPTSAPSFLCDQRASPEPLEKNIPLQFKDFELKKSRSRRFIYCIQGLLRQGGLGLLGCLSWSILGRWCSCFSQDICQVQLNWQQNFQRDSCFLFLNHQWRSSLSCWHFPSPRDRQRESQHQVLWP